MTIISPAPVAAVSGADDGDALSLTVDGGHHTPVPLDDPGRVWVVERRHADIFAVSPGAGGRDGRRHYLFRVEEGGVLPGGMTERNGLRLIAIGGLDSRLRTRSAAPTVTEAEGWIRRLAQAAMGPDTVWPERVAEPGESTLPGDAVLHADPRRILWLTLTQGAVTLPGGERLTAGDPPLPLADRLWVRVDGGEARLTIATGMAALPPLERFHRMALGAVRERLERSGAVQSAMAATTRVSEDTAFTAAIDTLAGTVHRRRTARAGDDDPIAAALRPLLEHVGVTVARLPTLADVAAGTDPVDATLTALDLRSRRVVLPADWWRREADALLGRFGPGQTPVALLPGRPWRAVGLGIDTAIDATAATQIHGEARQLYRPLPPRCLRFSDLFRLGLTGMGRDGWRLAAAGLAAAVIGLFTPAVTGVLFDQVVPNGESGMLGAIVTALVAAGLGTSVFHIAKSITLLRLESRFEAIAQPALMDRMLRLPARFFRAHSAGDLADRLLGMQQARQILTGSTLSGLFGAVFGLTSFGLLVTYDVRLALVAFGLVLVTVALDVGLALGRLRHERRMLTHQGRLDGFVLQLFMGIAKLRTAAAERRAMAQWVRHFSRQRDRFVSARQWAAMQETAAAILPTLASLALYLTVAMLMKSDGGQAALQALAAEQAGKPPPDPAALLSTGSFVAFAAAFGQLMGSVSALGSALAEATMAIPLIERARPLLDAIPEAAGQADDPGPLRGGIELRRVTFRYLPDGPPVLNELTLSIEPGQFVALVGASGSGKSTVMRLLLGFERPETGEVFFDGKGADRLDAAAIRRQIGVVLQNGRISAGSLASNILGPHGLGLDDAWAAARLVGLDRDIEEMPMGMHTVLLDGGGTLSGGQRQRLLIARALVHRPRILLLDEATSALDNRTQAIVTETLAKLGVTRVVIAHRLSTIRGVDRVFVLERGRLAQAGGYDELMEREGPFADLARRQTL